MCGFKLLSFGAICYATIDNKHPLCAGAFISIGEIHNRVSEESTGIHILTVNRWSYISSKRLKQFLFSPALALTYSSEPNIINHLQFLLLQWVKKASYFCYHLHFLYY